MWKQTSENVAPGVEQPKIHDKLIISDVQTRLEQVARNAKDTQLSDDED
jgi:hypothetical protein